MEKRPVDKQCLICNKKFTTTPSQNQKFCSIKCVRIWSKGKSFSPQTQFKKGNKPFYMGKKLPKWLKKKLSIAHQLTKKGKGELHYKWKGGKTGYYRDIANKVFREFNVNIICEKCGNTQNIDIHHRDRNVKNNNVSNLQALCHSCHTSLHWKLDYEKRKKVSYEGRWGNKIKNVS